MQNSQEHTCDKVIFKDSLIPITVILLKKELHLCYSTVNFAEFLRKVFLKNNLGVTALVQTQPAFTCLKLTIETQGVKYVQS